MTHVDWRELRPRDSRNDKVGWEFNLVICPGGGGAGILEDNRRPSPQLEASLTMQQLYRMPWRTLNLWFCCELRSEAQRICGQPLGVTQGMFSLHFQPQRLDSRFIVFVGKNLLEGSHILLSKKNARITF